MTQPQRPDKKEVLGETFTDEKLKLFFQYTPYDNTSEDFHILEKAYRGLPIEAFERFLELFLAEGKDLRSKNNKGFSFLETPRNRGKLLIGVILIITGRKPSIVTFSKY